MKFIHMLLSNVIGQNVQAMVEINIIIMYMYLCAYMVC